MGMYASIYRSDYDSSLNYFYGKNRINIVNVPGPFKPTQEDIESGNVAMICPNANNTVAIRPATLVNGEWVPVISGMAGGTFGETSDSRFSETASKILGHYFYGAISIHDRFENGR